MAQRTTLKEFESVFPKLEEAILDHAKTFNLPEQQLDWYKRVCALLFFCPYACF
jgi:farnesyl diphosphate synthase